MAKYKSYFQFFHTAWRTLRGYGIMNAILKGQVENINKGDILGQRDFVHRKMFEWIPIPRLCQVWEETKTSN